MPDKILKINDLAVEYRNKGKYLRVLQDINLELDSGKILALVGESGSGKSTLGKTILRLLPDSARIKEGSIFLKVKISAIYPKKILMIRFEVRKWQW